MDPVLGLVTFCNQNPSMETRSLGIGVLALSAVLACLPVVAQPDKPGVAVDLNERLAEAQANPKLADTLFKTGRRVATFCANCHGEGGNSIKPDVPNLAGQNTAYLMEQLRRFADGRRRNDFMEGVIKAMSSDEKVGIALFFSAQQVPYKPAADAALAAKGEEVYQKICFRCHGNDGRGNAQFARIAGQQTDYLGTTLKRYRTGTGVRMDPLMANNTRLLTDANIDAVVAYVAAMK
jgi:cytochrome c553